MSGELKILKKYQRLKRAAKMLTLVAFSVFSIAAAQVGTRYWLTDAHLASTLSIRLGPTKWVEVIGDAPIYPPSYEVRLSNGNTDIVKKDWIDDAIAAKALVTYDPVAKAKAAKVTAERTRIDRIKAKKWPPEISLAVIERKVLLGMTREQVESAWGKPQRNHRSVGSWGVHEQWVYGDTRLFFEGDRLTSFQDSR